MHWQLQEAKNKLSRLIQLSKSEGPQIITVRGNEEAVILSSDEYRRLTHRDTDLVSFLEESPWGEMDSLEIERSRDTGRDISL